MTRPSPPADWAGLAAWLAREYPDVPTTSVAALAERLRGPDPPQLVDVRTPAEQAVSTLAGALCVTPPVDVATLVQQLRRDRPVVVYCAVGVRSARLARQLLVAGFPDVRNLAGGLFAWANAGGALVRGGLPVGEVHGYDPTWAVLLDPARRTLPTPS